MSSPPSNKAKEQQKKALNLEPKFRQSCNFCLVLHMIWITWPLFGIRLPWEIFEGHLLPFLTFYAYKSLIQREIGRPWIPDYAVRVVRYYLGRGSPAEGRATIFGRNTPYSVFFALPSWRKHKEWLKYVSEPGITGRWMADFTRERRDDDVVMLFAHGGGFVIDTGGFCQLFWLNLMKEMHLKRGIKLSVFQLDYEMAPDYQFPSQLIEVTAAYAWMVNKLGIDPKKIVIAGDSAGAQMVAATLLHLARPSPDIVLPETFGRLPPTPGASFLISPFIKLLSNSHSYTRNETFDFIEVRCASLFALQYMGCVDIKPNWRVSFDPLHVFTSPHPTAQSYITPSGFGTAVDVEKNKIAQVKLHLKNPYMNPGDLQDLDWWKEAMPEKNMIVWGGKEIMADDIASFARMLEEAEIPIKRLKKELSVHDWILFEPSIPWLKNNKGKGPDTKPDWGVNHVADFLQGFVTSAKESYKSSEAGSSAGETF